MALGLREGGAGELRGKEGGDAATGAASAYRYAATDSFAYEGMPPPAQQMDRQPAVVLGSEGVHDDGRIPASVFERDMSEPGKDWSMMSTESVFGLQVAPSCDFTGYFLSHPELMDIATPPRDSSAAPAEAASPPPRNFDTIPELGDAAPSYSFAFPNLMEDKTYSSKKAQQFRELPPTPKTAPSGELAGETAAPEEATSGKPEAEPEQEAPKGGIFSWLPCCS
ncbi:pollen-specific protein [Hordeum vulgare]|nr:pollen-specific protein [Hordeum vulgare]